MNIVFVHGWGFNAEVWGPLSAALPGNHYFADLGFIAGGKQDALPENAIVIGHSLGVLWALKHLKPQALISIAGFDCFHTHVPPTLTRTMHRNLDTAPYKQMQEFWAACGVEAPYTEEKLNIPKLKQGLSWLLEWQAEIPETFEILALAAKDDTIVPPDMTKAIWQNKNLHWTESGGHMLQLSQTSWCAKQIEVFIHGLQLEGSRTT